ncbi:MAG TPA: protein kinase [Planctomycetota bacterium]|nr:protein kinase [Planctomycetota bacterium]
MSAGGQTSLSQIQESLFGALAVRYHFVLEHQVKEALQIQQQFQQAGQPVPRMGEILAQRGYITTEQVQAVLKGQLASGSRRFGELAIGLQFCSQADIEAALQVQQQIKACGSHQRVGEILVARGALRPHQVHAVLKQQGKAVIACPGCTARLNVSGVSPGSTVRCPRCKTVIRPPSAEDTEVAEEEAAPSNVRADMSVVMPAVGGQSSGGGISRMANAVVGTYQLGEKLGTDSSGVLYKGFDPQHGTHVAIRMLSPSAANTRQAIDRWISAGEAASELVHPNLQRILSISTDGGRVYLVLEYVDGESLRKSLARRSKFPVLEAVDVLIQMAEALAYGHGHGFLHGDLRPAHVLIGFDGIVRISGLGTPKNVSLNLRQVAGQLGEEALPLYTAPEVMIDEENAEERSDIYSLGAIGYQMLTGRPPHQGTNVLQVGLKIASENPVPPRNIDARIPPYINRLICKCLNAEPNERYDAMVGILEDLRKARQALLSDVADVPEIGAPTARMSGMRAAVGTGRNLKEEARSKKRLHTHVIRGGHGGRSGQHAAVGGRTGRHGAVTGKQRAVGPRRGARSSSMMRAVGHAAPAEMPAPVAPQPVSSASRLPAVVAPRPRKPGSPDEPVDLLGDIDPLSAGPAKAYSPNEDADLDEQIEEQEAIARKKRKEGPPLDQGVSTKVVLIGTAVVVVLIIILFVVAGRNKPAPVAATNTPAKPKTDEPVQPAVVVKSDTRALSEWKLIDDHIKANPSDFSGIVRRLEAFKLKFVDTPTPAEQASDAVSMLKQYSTLGANATLPDLRTAMQKFLDDEKFGDAEKAVDRWKDQWTGDAETANTAKALRAEIAQKQKQMAESRMNEAAAFRKERKWEQAYAAYKRITENYEQQYSDAARKARLEAMAESESTQSAEQREAIARKAAEAQAAKEAAAPARLQQLSADLEAALKSFNLEQGKRLLDNAFDLLSGTPQGPDYVELKNDYNRMVSLRDRMVKGIKAGKFSDPRVTYRNQQYVAVDCTDKGPIIEAGTGKVPIPWSDIAGEDIAEIAKRASHSENGLEMLELGMIRFYLGKYFDAKKALTEAQRLGAPVSRFLPRAEAKLKETAAKPEPAPEVVAPPPATNTKPEPAAAGGADPEMVKALADKGLEINRGIWKLQNNIWQAFGDPTDSNTTLMSLKRSLKKTFSKVSIEVRGTGDQAGFSFGKDRRFVIKPDGGWQRVTVERKDNRIVFTVDNAPRESVEPIGQGVNADNLVSEGIMYIRFQGTKGEFRNLTVVE